MNADHLSERLDRRMDRAADEAASQGFDALVIAPSPDLAYLTGYDPMPLERATLLVLRADRPPAMLVPELERPLAATSPAGASIELIGWVDGVDPYAVAAKLLPPDARVAVGDRCWSSHLLALQAALPGTTFSPASPVIGRLRAIKDDDELAARRRVVPSDLHDDVPRTPGGRDRCGPGRSARSQRPRERRVHDRRERTERCLAAPRARRTHHLAPRRRRDGFRRSARRLFQ